MKFEKELKELFLMQQVYASLFSVSNKLQIKGDQYFGNLSSRQYMTILAILHLPENEATLNGIAKKLGTSKQNAKQLVSILERKGYLVSKIDTKDKRALSVTVTETGFYEMVTCGESSAIFMADVFNDFSEQELVCLWSLLQKLYHFDGVAHDGFKEEADRNSEVLDEEKLRVLQKFSERRNKNNHFEV